FASMEKHVISPLAAHYLFPTQSSLLFYAADKGAKSYRDRAAPPRRMSRPVLQANRALTLSSDFRDEFCPAVPIYSGGVPESTAGFLPAILPVRHTAGKAGYPDRSRVHDWQLRAGKLQSDCRGVICKHRCAIP